MACKLAYSRHPRSAGASIMSIWQPTGRSSHMADQNKVEKQVESALGKMQKNLKQAARKVKA